MLNVDVPGILLQVVIGELNSYFATQTRQIANTCTASAAAGVCGSTEEARWALVTWTGVAIVPNGV